MARAGGGGRGGGFRGGFSGGGSRGGGFGGGHHHHHHHYRHRTVIFFGRSVNLGFVSNMVMLGIFLVLLIAMFAAMLSDAIVTNNETDGVLYDEKVFQKYADSRYKEAFGAYEGVEDNILIAFLANKEADRYYCIAWVGDNIKNDIAVKFGGEGTPFGNTMNATVQQYYEYSLDSDLVATMDHMSSLIYGSSIISPFIKDHSYTNRPESYLINHTEIDIDKYAVSEALVEFTEKTKIPAVIVVDYMDNVFEDASIADSEMSMPMLVIVAMIGILGFSMYKEIANHKKLTGKKLYVEEDENADTADNTQDKSYENEADDPEEDSEKREPEEEKEEKTERKKDAKKKKDSKYGRDYDKSRYNKKI